MVQCTIFFKENKNPILAELFIQKQTRRAPEIRLAAITQDTGILIAMLDRWIRSVAIFF